MTPNKDTQLFISVSKVPGNFGARVYNALFRRYQINAVYLPRCAPESPLALANAIRTLGIVGCSVSMPLKSRILSALDSVDHRAQSIESVNTITHMNGVLTGFNTDYLGISRVLHGALLSRVIIFGNGGVVSAVIHALRELGVRDISVSGRDAERVTTCALRWNVASITTAEEVSSLPTFDLLINATPASITPPPPLLVGLLSVSRAFFDLTPMDTESPLTVLARDRGCRIYHGLDMFKFQVQAQFKIYTGVEPSLTDIEDALSSS